jgi:hypothetical protein
MNTPPPHEEPVDELTAWYRRLSAVDPSRPNPRVREAVLAQAKLGASRQRGAATYRRAGTWAASANERSWSWRAAAGIAAAGLIGLISWQELRTVAPADTARHATRVTDNARSFDVPKPAAGESERAVAPVPESAHKAAGPPASAAKQPVAPQASRILAAPNAERNPASTPVPASAGGPPVPQPEAGASHPSPVPTAALSSDVAKLSNALERPAPTIAQPMLSAGVRTVSSPWNDKVLLAVRSNYPELFAADAAAGVTRVTIVLNSNGSVFKSIKESPTDAAALVATEQISRMLKVNAEALSTSGMVTLPSQSTGGLSTLIVVFGVLR